MKILSNGSYVFADTSEHQKGVLRVSTPLTGEPVWYAWSEGGWMLEDGLTDKMEAKYQALLKRKGTCTPTGWDASIDNVDALEEAYQEVQKELKQ